MNGKLRTGLLSVMLVGALALTPFRTLKVSGQSMEPTLRNGETYLLDQWYWKQGGLKRSDIVVVQHGDEKWVKRLAGMPGDRLAITRRPDGWITFVANLTVNPKLIERAREPGADVEEKTVGKDEIFVIGDNLNRSADSTNQEAGAFKLEHVLGVVRTVTLRRDFPFRTHL